MSCKTNRVLLMAKLNMLGGKDTVVRTLETKEIQGVIIKVTNPRTRIINNNAHKVSMQFLIREGKLNLIVCMRSNDIYLGFPYDIFNFSMFQEYIAGKLGVKLGEYIHVVGSLHYYKKMRRRLKLFFLFLNNN